MGRYYIASQDIIPSVHWVISTLTGVKRGSTIALGPSTLDFCLGGQRNLQGGRVPDPEFEVRLWLQGHMTKKKWGG